MIVRRERAGEAAAVDAVIGAAFTAPDPAGEPIEVGLLRALREDEGWIPELALVAEREAAIVGSVVCTRGFVGDVPVVGLGPIGVLPDQQGAGVGHALMHAVLGAAEATGEPLVALLGDTGFYARFGFEPASRLGIDSPEPDWGDHFQARRLAGGTAEPRGAFRYARPFDDL